MSVAQAVLKELRENGYPPAPYAIAPLTHHIVWSHTQWPSSQDDAGRVTLRDDWFEYAARQQYPKTWNTDLLLEVACPICRSHAPDQSYVPAKVLIQSDSLDEKILIPEAFHCVVCGFRIDTQERFLAKHFVPPISDETAEKFLEDLGIT